MTLRLDEMLKEHMEEQPYSIDCTCGKELQVESVNVDIDLDLHLKVYPCPDCCKD